MSMYEIIKNKRDGLDLTTQEINYFIREYTNNKIADYQASALLMAICINGMNSRETLDLTIAMQESGKTVDLSAIKGVKVDKHSTGGVGDKTTLIVAPVVAACGVKLAKMSGRGLGHTGGTIDKLESIPGFISDIENSRFLDTVNQIGISVIGQSENICPADKKLYALRDVTATVDSIPLIASSIMSKKLAAGSDCILLDVKVGSGAFMKTAKQAKELAQLMVSIGKGAGKKTSAVLTDMDTPLGNAVGNSIEVIEAIKTLSGRGPKDLTDLCVFLSTNLLFLAGVGSKEECALKVKDVIFSGEAKEKLAQMVKAQGGNRDYVDNPNLFNKAKHKYFIKSEIDGYISKMDTEKCGDVSVMLKAGRLDKNDTIDHAAGIVFKKKTGDYVKENDVIAELYADSDAIFSVAQSALVSAYTFDAVRPLKKDIIIDIVE